MLSWQTPPEAQSDQYWACACSLQTLQQQHVAVDSTCTTVGITPSSHHLSIQDWIRSLLPASHRQTAHYFKTIELICFWVMSQSITHTEWADFICITHLYIQHNGHGYDSHQTFKWKKKDQYWVNQVKGRPSTWTVEHTTVERVPKANTDKLHTVR